MDCKNCGKEIFKDPVAVGLAYIHRETYKARCFPELFKKAMLEAEPKRSEG